MRLRIPCSCLALALALAACNENEERVVVHPDGSVDVSLHVKGSVGDLSAGYPLPLDGQWVPEGRAAELWLAHVGPDTGSVLTRALASEVDWRALGVMEEEGKLELGARARFASVADWPRFFAPPAEPYREAGLERSAELRLEQRGKYRVYTFERTYHGRRRERYDLAQLLFERAESLPEDLVEKLEKELPLAPDETRLVAAEVAEVFRAVYGRFAEDALLLDDELLPDEQNGIPSPARARIVRAARERVSRQFDELRIARLLEELRDDGGEREDEDGVDPFEALEREARDVLRSALAEALVAEGLEETLRYAALWRLEFGFSFADQTTDLSDEKFQVSVELPGTILSGNYDELEGGRAIWRFDFDAIAGADLHLRAVSVVE